MFLTAMIAPAASAAEMRLLSKDDLTAALAASGKAELRYERQDSFRDTTLTPGLARKTVPRILRSLALDDDLRGQVQRAFAAVDTPFTWSASAPVCDTCALVRQDVLIVETGPKNRRNRIAVDPCGEKVYAITRDAAGSGVFRESESGLVRTLLALLERTGGPLPASDRSDCGPYTRGEIATMQFPEVLEPVSPEYPEAARRSGIEGTVLVMALVGKDGSVQDVRVRESVPVLDAAALAAVRRWRFRPAQSNGQPLEVWAACPVRFALH